MTPDPTAAGLLFVLSVQVLKDFVNPFGTVTESTNDIPLVAAENTLVMNVVRADGGVSNLRVYVMVCGLIKPVTIWFDTRLVTVNGLNVIPGPSVPFPASNKLYDIGSEMHAATDGPTGKTGSGVLVGSVGGTNVVGEPESHWHRSYHNMRNTKSRAFAKPEK